MKYLMITALVFGLAFPLMAAGKKHHHLSNATPVPTLVVTPSPLAAPWDKVTLKDGQMAEGKIRGYDAFFLEFQAKNATRFHIPWREVSDLAPAEFSGDAAIMKRYLTPDVVEVQSIIQPKDPGQALSQALWPGFILHGEGYHQAGDDSMFYSLAGLELFGVGISAVGLSLSGDSSDSNMDQTISNGMAIAGGVLFLGTWVWDLAGSGSAAHRFNDAHHLSFSMVPSTQGSLMTAQLRF